jgi:hypothetical protein
LNSSKFLQKPGTSLAGVTIHMLTYTSLNMKHMRMSTSVSQNNKGWGKINFLLQSANIIEKLSYGKENHELNCKKRQPQIPVIKSL